MTPDDETGRTLPASGAEMAPEDADAATRAREARYAEAWNNAEARWCEGETHSADAELGRDEYCARAVMAVADAEQAELRAEVERLRQAGESLAAQGFEALDRAEAVEAELRALREGIVALADDLVGEVNALFHGDNAPREAGRVEGVRQRIVALLAPSPAATTGEACGCTITDQPMRADSSFRGLYVCGACTHSPHPDGACPAPVVAPSAEGSE